MLEGTAMASVSYSVRRSSGQSACGTTIDHPSGGPQNPCDGAPGTKPLPGLAHRLRRTRRGVAMAVSCWWPAIPASARRLCGGVPAAVGAPVAVGSLRRALHAAPAGSAVRHRGELGGELFALCRQDAPREELFRVFLEQIDGGAQPTVVAVEDIHWADEATRPAALHGPAPLGNRTLLIATYRDDEVQGNRALEVVLGDLARQRAVRRMLLPPLSPVAVQTLAAGRPADPAELYRLTGGNPFYLSEILDAGPEVVPTSARDAVMARMSRLLGRPAGWSRLREWSAAGSTPAILETVAEDEGIGLDHAVASGMLVSEAGGLRFRHELARMAVEGSIPTIGRWSSTAASCRSWRMRPRSSTPCSPTTRRARAMPRRPASCPGGRPAVGTAGLAPGGRRAVRAGALLRRRDRLGGPGRTPPGLAYELSLVDRWEEATRNGRKP